MKLLNKYEVAGLKAKEKSLEIQEGAKLAKKIDVLRETVAKEEMNLNKFRAESLRLIREEMVALTNERDMLKQEVQKLQEEKEQLTNAIQSVRNY